MKSSVSVIVFVSLATAVSAQEKEPAGPPKPKALIEKDAKEDLKNFSGMRKIVVPTVRYGPAKRIDKKFVFSGLVLEAGSKYDVYTTLAVKKRCPNCIEKNIFARPFVEAGSAVLYVADTGGNAGLMALAYTMRGSRHKFLRNTWWAVPVGGSIIHSICGMYNNKLHRQRH